MAYASIWRDGFRVVSRAHVFACLPWYDLSELRRSNDALWTRIAAELATAGVPGVPRTLDRVLHYEDQWDSGELLLGQACGYDVAIAYAHQLQLVATPCYAIEGCEGASYRSLVVVPADATADSIESLRGARCVINTPTSHSGMNVLRSLVAPFSENGRFFASAIVSGAHETSLALLRANEADVAAIDCITYGLIRAVRPELLDGTRVIHRTVAVPAPPYVTSTSTPPAVVAALRTAIGHAIADRTISAPLALESIETLSLSDYDAIVELERQADVFGYSELPSVSPRRGGREAD